MFLLTHYFSWEVGTNFLELLTRFERPAEAPAGPPAAVRARYRVVEYLGLPGVARPLSASGDRAARALARDAPPAVPTDRRPHRPDARSARRRRRETDA